MMQSLVPFLVISLALALALAFAEQGSKAHTPTTIINMPPQQGPAADSMDAEQERTFSGIAHKLARPNILELHPYRCARDDYSDGILLDANENAYGPTAPAQQVQDNKSREFPLERYPDPYQLPLKELYCQHRGHGLRPSQVFVGVGSDEAIDLLMRIFCKPGSDDSILITPPTYGMYKVCAKVNDVKIQSDVALTPDFDVPVDEILDACTANTKLLFLCSPGNPTAKRIPISVIEAVASSPKYNGLVVVDEAYIDFVDDVSTQSAVSLLQRYSNIVVLQTLSKAFGLAGIRCGFCLGAPDVIQLMNNVKAPYNVNVLTSEVAVRAMKSIDTLQSNVASTLSERARVAEALNAMTDKVAKVYPSDSNFILFRLKLPSNNYVKDLYVRMAEAGVVTRFRGTEMHCDRCIRVTIGKPEENEEFLRLFEKLYEEVASEATAAN